MFWATFILIGGINMNRSFFNSGLLYFIIIILLSVFVIPIYSYYPEFFVSASDFTNFDPSLEFIWPIPGYTALTSPYGKRISPTSRSLFLS